MAAALAERPRGALLGYSALIDHYGLNVPLPRRLTVIAPVGQKTTKLRDGVEWLLLPRNANFRFPDTAIAHLGVALKHEGTDLRVLSKLFNPGIENELTLFIQSRPAGLYTRRAWFLFEWMTGRRLPIEDLRSIQYAPALDPSAYVTVPGARSSRHKIDDNMPGVREFCPLIRRTERLSMERTQGLATAAKEAVSVADPTVLRRAAGFLLLNESKGSFGIEGETPPRNRLERWGRLIAGAKDIRLSIDRLAELHRSLFDAGQFAVDYGLRTTGGFIGRHDGRDMIPVPDHVSARPDDLRSLVGGLLATFDKLKASQFDPILTAAVLGFGFVFIHPFSDGNGRLHRFLCQKALVDTGFNPPGVVLPISAAILEDMLGYRAALEDYSSPTLPFIEWQPTADGNLDVTNDTAYLYRYFDATRQAEYLFDRIERTIRVSLPAELRYLRSFDEAKRSIACLVDLPDRLASLFIQFCVQNAGRLSNAKRVEYFAGLPTELIAELEQAVRRSGVMESDQAPTSTHPSESITGSGAVT